MHSHYADAEGRLRRIDAFLKQAITATDSVGKTDRKAVATAFAELAEVDEYDKDQHLFLADRHSYKVFLYSLERLTYLLAKSAFLLRSGEISWASSPC